VLHFLLRVRTGRDLSVLSKENEARASTCPYFLKNEAKIT